MHTANTEIYRHYKGGRYVLLHTAGTHEHNGDYDAVYVSLTTGNITTRPFTRDSRNQDSWDDMVPWPDGVERMRFTREIRIPKEALVKLEAHWKSKA